MLLISFGIFAQEVTTLTFSAKLQNGTEIKLDSVIVTNLTKGWTEVINDFDTTYSMPTTSGINEWGKQQGSVSLHQNFPNPFQGTTNFNLTLTNKEKVALAIYDINGKKVAEYRNTLPAGNHTFHATMSTPQTYLLSASTQSGNTAIKMINMSNTGAQARIEYVGSQALDMDMTRGMNPFSRGDSMRYVGYATINNACYSVNITQVQEGSENITFIFPSEQPEPAAIVGNWTMSSEDFGVKYSFKEDGTMSVTEMDSTLFGTYILKGDTLIMKIDTIYSSVRVIMQYENNVMTFRFKDEFSDDYSIADDFMLFFRDSAKINAPLEDIQGDWKWFMMGDTSVIRASLIITDTLFEFIIPVWREFMTGHIDYENGRITFHVDVFKTRGDMGEINESPAHLYDNWHLWTEDDFEHGEDPTFGYNFSNPFIAHGDEAFSIFANLPAYYVKQQK